MTEQTAATSGGAAQAIQVVTETRNLRTQPFIIPDEANSVGKQRRRTASAKHGKNGWRELSENSDTSELRRPSIRRML